LTSCHPETTKQIADDLFDHIELLQPFLASARNPETHFVVADRHVSITPSVYRGEHRHDGQFHRILRTYYPVS
jgi:hypothetical protein